MIRHTPDVIGKTEKPSKPDMYIQITEFHANIRHIKILVLFVYISINLEDRMLCISGVCFFFKS